MEVKKLEEIINTKIVELEEDKSKEMEYLNKFEFYSPMHLEILGNILVCDGKIELLNELLEMFN